MKRNLQLLFFALLFSTGALIAQPANDNCTEAIAVVLGSDKDSAPLTDGDTREGTGDLSVPDVCSGSWFMDDVWFYFDVPATVPLKGVTVLCTFGSEQTDLLAVGMALYTSCESSPSQCFSSSDPASNNLQISTGCLEANTRYLVRIWSGGSPTDNSGTFRIQAYETESIRPLLWQETFGGGMAANGWITEGLGTCAVEDSNANAVWVDLPDGVLDRGSFANPGVGISGPSFCDGAVGVDADYMDNLGGGLDANQNPITPGPCQRIGQYMLVSPALYTGDWVASGTAGLSMSWFQGYRDNGSSYFVSVRWKEADWGDWRNFTVNQHFLANGPHESIEESETIFLGAIAGDSVQIRFIYNGRYYYWGIDDVKILATEAHNMRSQSNFFAIAPALETPATQVVPFHGLNDIYNAGAIEQTNVMLNLTVENNAGGIVYNESIPYGSIKADSLAENVNFPTAVMPPVGDIDTYFGRYLVWSDSTMGDDDFDPSDNFNDFSFRTTEATYSLTDTRTRSIAVNDAIYTAGAPLSYTFGIYAYFPTGSSCEAESVGWGLDNPEDLVGSAINVILWEWTDTNGDQIAQNSERQPIGFSTVTIQGDEPEIIESDLENTFNQGEPIQLKDDQGYLVMIEYTDMSADQTFMFLAANDEIDYSAQRLASEQAGKPTYSSVLGFSPDGNIQGIDYELVLSDDDNRIYFSPDITPLVTLNVKNKVSATSDPLSDDNLIEVFPNPAQDNLTLSLEFVDVQDEVRIQIIDVSGKLIESRELKGVQTEQVKFNVSKYVSGSYMLNVQTEAGSRTKRFVVQN